MKNVVSTSTPMTWEWIFGLLELSGHKYPSISSHNVQYPERLNDNFCDCKHVAQDNQN